MKITIKENTVYFMDGNHCSESLSMRHNMLKLNLFSNQQRSRQIEQIQQLANQFTYAFYFELKATTNNCYWNLYIDVDQLSQLKKQLLESQFDYLFWPVENHQPPGLLVFDMDSTFIQIEVIDELAKLHNVGQQVAKITEQAMQGELDFAKSLIARVACLKGLDYHAIDHIANQLPLSPGVATLVKQAKQNDCETTIVSGGFLPFVEKIKQQMNIYKVDANQLEIKQGKLTGKLSARIVDAQHKANFLKQCAQQLALRKEQVMAIGDGANDLKMMKAAGFSLAYQAKPKVEQQANGRIRYTSLDRLCDLFEWSD